MIDLAIYTILTIVVGGGSFVLAKFGLRRTLLQLGLARPTKAEAWAAFKANEIAMWEN